MRLLCPEVHGCVCLLSPLCLGVWNPSVRVNENENNSACFKMDDGKKKENPSKHSRIPLKAT